MIYKLKGLDPFELGELVTKMLWKRGLHSTTHDYIEEHGGYHQYYFFADYNIILDSDYDDVMNRFDYVEQVANEVYKEFLNEMMMNKTTNKLAGVI